MRIRIFRLLVCLMVICSLLVNLLPTRAEASVIGGVISIEAAKAVGSAIIGLGIAAGASIAAFDALSNSAIGQMISDGVPITDGKIDLYSLGDGKYGMKGSLLQSLFDWIWADSGIISDPTSSFMSANLKAAMQLKLNEEIASQGAPLYVLCTGSKSQGYVNWMCVSKYPFVAVKDTYVSYDSSGSKVYFSVHAFEKSGTYIIKNSYNTIYWSDSTIILHGTDAGFDYAVSEGLTANFIASPGTSLATGYPAWAANSVTIPNAETGEEEVYYPIALGNSLEETQSMTQEQVWAGEGTYVDTETGTGSGSITVPDTVTLKDILAGVLSVPQSIAQAVTGLFSNVVAAVQAIPAAITDFFTIRPGDLVFPISLMNFFPFCIPGDIYELVTVFDAEPEAPHFVYDVDFPYMDEPWHIDVDLDPWDPVAQVLRRLELLLFIVGLAMATRNYYIRG